MFIGSWRRLDCVPDGFEGLKSLSDKLELSSSFDPSLLTLKSTRSNPILLRTFGCADDSSEPGPTQLSDEVLTTSMFTGSWRRLDCVPDGFEGLKLLSDKLELSSSFDPSLLTLKSTRSNPILLRTFGCADDSSEPGPTQLSDEVLTTSMFTGSWRRLDRIPDGFEGLKSLSDKLESVSSILF